MVEYISSNDDAGNLGLYAGIGAVTFAGGAALAYRATSPIYKNGDKSKGKNGPKLAAVTTADDVASGGKRGLLGKLFANPMEGALNQVRADAVNSVNNVMNTKRQLKKDQAGMDAVDANYAAQHQAEKEQKAKMRAIGKKQSDMDYVQDMLKQNPNMSADDLHGALQKAKPNTLISAGDVQKRVDRYGKQQTQLATQEAERVRKAQSEAASSAWVAKNRPDVSSSIVRDANFNAGPKFLDTYESMMPNETRTERAARRSLKGRLGRIGKILG